MHFIPSKTWYMAGTQSALFPLWLDFVLYAVTMHEIISFCCAKFNTEMLLLYVHEVVEVKIINKVPKREGSDQGDIYITVENYFKKIDCSIFSTTHWTILMAYIFPAQVPIHPTFYWGNVWHVFYQFIARVIRHFNDLSVLPQMRNKFSLVMLMRYTVKYSYISS